MNFLPQFIFVLILLTTIWIVFKRISLIRRTILLGKHEDLTDQKSIRLRRMFRFAFGQKKMFDRPIIGIVHGVVYLGFLLINIELIEIVVDGLVGSHRILLRYLGGLYDHLLSFIELLAIGVIIACSIFLIRRNVFSVPRLQAHHHRELQGWPSIDANIILGIEIVLMWLLLSMNASDWVLQQRLPEQYPSTGPYLISSLLVPLFEHSTTSFLIIYERTAWWLHIGGIFAFTIYITYSKHLHIFLAFPNTYFARLTTSGQLTNMPEITQEVRLLLGISTTNESNNQPIPEIFGAKDIHNLSWKSLLDAYTCTECGRCSSVCPATLTGKSLSPRKIMTDTRDRLEEVGKLIQNNPMPVPQDGKSLLNDYISQEEILACTTCQACVEACPVLINPLHIIMELRRYQIMNLSEAPTTWNQMFSNIETSQTPWKFAPSDRFNWATKNQ